MFGSTVYGLYEFLEIVFFPTSLTCLPFIPSALAKVDFWFSWLSLFVHIAFCTWRTLHCHPQMSRFPLASEDST